METLGHIPPEKQTRIARETLEIYVPISHRLGMGKIRKELEDLAFPYVYPDESQRVKEILQTRFGKAAETLEKERKVLQKRLAEVGFLKFSTSFRVKGLYSMFHKLKRKEWDVDAIYDLLAMRLVVDSVEDCYRALGIIHELWRPLPGRVKDYIAFPKPNGYQSIHTTVTTQNGVILEIQIRTSQMHREAEFGVASHILYKQPTSSNLFRPFSNRGEVGEDSETIAAAPHNQKIPHWISQIGLAYNNDSKNLTSDFVEDAESDFFSKRIFVFTPNGDVVDLPVGATPIDFAYAIHSEIGGHTMGSVVNKKLVQLDSELKNGDIVEIQTRKSAKPSRKWLQFAKTSVARRKIKVTLEEAGEY
jgi:GTP pyrophosphokinase